LRFQAQYLRRIRAPRWNKVPDQVRKDLINAAQAHDQRVVDEPVFRLFGLDEHESAMVSALAEAVQVRPVAKLLAESSV
ncbi:MAG: hypothetical protein GXP62_17905, partial [Oligoflexia bacterium]|nr:hypothetical protein [Oligoflexia bacterium]